jgi:hypothetical protein
VRATLRRYLLQCIRAAHKPRRRNSGGRYLRCFRWALGERGTDGEYLAFDNPVARTRPLPIDRAEDSIDPFGKDEIKAIIQAVRRGGSAGS